MGWFHEAAKELLLPVHFSVFAEAVELVTQTKERMRAEAIIHVRQQRENLSGGIAYIVSADVVFEADAIIFRDAEPPTMHPSGPAFLVAEILKATFRVSFRGQTFAVQTVGPESPDGTVTVSVMNERSEYTSNAGFGR